MQYMMDDVMASYPASAKVLGLKNGHYPKYPI